MSQKKDEAIVNIIADYEKLANLVLRQLDILEKLIASGKLRLDDAEQEDFVKNEEKINKLEVKLSEEVINSIALYQPVASQIRK